MTDLMHWIVVGSAIPELAMIAKLTIVLAGGLVAARLAVRSSAALRHQLLAATFAALVALPIVRMIAPTVAIDLPVASAPDVEPAIGTMDATVPDARAARLATTETSARLPSLPQLAAVLRVTWAFVTLALLAGLVIAVWRFERLRRRGVPWTERGAQLERLATTRGIDRPVDLLLHEDLAAPATWGRMRPAILLPMDATGWSEEDLRRALVHELEHVRRGDSATQLFARAVCALYWFHPLVWLALRRLRIEAERACDDAVLEHAEAADYAEQLVTLARRMWGNGSGEPALAMANRTDLATRIRAILDVTQARGRLGALSAAAVLGCAVVLAATVAPLCARALDADARYVAGADDEWSRRAARPVDRALYESAGAGDLESVSALIAAGANVNAAIEGDGSPLIAAARSGSIAAVNFLIDRGADVNMIVPGDGSPLIMASAAGHVGIVEVLLDRGAAIDQVAPGDENALITASGAGILPVVQLLVERGADVNARVWVETLSFGGGNVRTSGEWRTPLGVARKAHQPAVAAYLESVGARP